MTENIKCHIHPYSCKRRLTENHSYFRPIWNPSYLEESKNFHNKAKQKDGSKPQGSPRDLGANYDVLQELYSSPTHTPDQIQSQTLDQNINTQLRADNAEQIQ